MSMQYSQLLSFLCVYLPTEWRWQAETKVYIYWQWSSTEHVALWPLYICIEKSKSFHLNTIVEHHDDFKTFIINSTMAPIFRVFPSLKTCVCWMFSQCTLSETVFTDVFLGASFQGVGELQKGIYTSHTDSDRWELSWHQAMKEEWAIISIWTKRD